MEILVLDRGIMVGLVGHLSLQHDPDAGVGRPTVHHDTSLHVEQERDCQSFREEAQTGDLQLLKQVPEQIGKIGNL